MRIKNFTLLLIAVLFSAVGFAQKSIPAGKQVAIKREAKIQLSAKQNALLPSLAVKPQNNFGRRTAAVTAPAKASEVVTPPSDGEVEYFTLAGQSTKGGNVTRTVQLIWDGDDDVYISGLSYYMPDAFVKGVFQDDVNVLFEKGQYMGSLDGQDVYFGGVENDAFVDVVARFDADENAFVFDGTMTVVDNGDAEGVSVLASWKNLTIAPMSDDVDRVVEIPNGMEVEKYSYTAYDYFDDVEISGNLNIGFYGNDMYIQGMSSDFPEAWIKGRFENDSTIVFPSGQLLSESTELYFVAINDNFDVVDSYSLIYEASTGIFYEGPEAPIINAYKDIINRSVYQFCYGYEIKPITEHVATPAKSVISSVEFTPTSDNLEFSLAKVDVDGDGLVADKLFYKLYYSDENGEVVNVPFTKADYPTLSADLEEMPSDYTDNYIQDGKLALRTSGHESWSSVGIQCVYYGGNERREGEIAWYTPTWPVTVALPEGATVTEHTLKVTQALQSGSAEVEKKVGLAFVGNDMYIRGIGDTNDDAWIKGTKNADGNYVFAKGQDLGRYGSYYRLFFVGFDDDGNATDVVVSLNAADAVYQFEQEYRENASYTDKSYYLNRYLTGATISVAEAEEEVLEVVELPEGVETETWSFTATDYFDNVAVSRSVQVGFSGEDVYVQGLSKILPEAWVQGIVEDGQITFPAGQYLGSYHGTYDIFFLGWNTSNGSVFDYLMEYDEENGVMTNSSETENIGINIYKNRISGSLFESYNTVTIKKVTEKAVVPATPAVSTIAFTPYGNVAEFNVPTVDVDGDGLVADKLSYKLYYDEGDGEAKEVTFTTDLYEKLTEDMAAVPYGFTDDYDFTATSVYLNMENSSWTRIGIQSIYEGGGETNVSEIGWYTILWPTTTELPEGAEVASYSFEGAYYQSSGSVDFSKTVNVAFVGDDVYVQGVGRADAEAWIKGTKGQNGVYTFAKGQTLGTYESSDGYDDSYLFLMGYSETFGAIDVRMAFDEETGTLTTTTELVENADYVDKLYYLTRILSGAVIAPVPDVAATPATPVVNNMAFSAYGDYIDFNIPVEDVNGATILSDKLSYKVYYDEGDGEAKELTFTTDLYEYLAEDMTVVPYGFLDDVDEDGNPSGYDFYETRLYLNMETSSWTRVGIQSIYSGGDQTIASEIGWYTIVQPWIASLPEDAEIESYGFEGTLIDGTAITVGGMSLAKAGDNVYIQGLSSADPNAWIVGTLDDNGNYTFALGQYLGLLSDENYYFTLFLLGYDASGATELQMTYDEETRVFTTTNYLVENVSYTDRMYYNRVFMSGAKLIPSDSPDAIASVAAETGENVVRYNVAGQRVGKNYKGIVVENGQKILRK